MSLSPESATIGFFRKVQVGSKLRLRFVVQWRVKVKKVPGEVAIE